MSKINPARAVSMEATREKTRRGGGVSAILTRMELRVQSLCPGPLGGGQEAVVVQGVAESSLVTGRRPP